jgi:hypothetical protein
MTAIYGKVHHALLAETTLHTYGGVVRPHPEFSLVLDARGLVLHSHADLAVILLDGPASMNLPTTQLAGGETEPGELLVMAGYGPGTETGQPVGLRYSRMNKVTSTPASPGGRVLYEQRGPYLYDGFQGGPCFREARQGRWLAGIASIGTSQELAFTSTATYQGWLRAELRHAEESLPTSPGVSP